MSCCAHCATITEPHWIEEALVGVIDPAGEILVGQMSRYGATPFTILDARIDCLRIQFDQRIPEAVAFP